MNIDTNLIRIQDRNGLRRPADRTQLRFFDSQDGFVVVLMIEPGRKPVTGHLQPGADGSLIIPIVEPQPEGMPPCQDSSL